MTNNEHSADANPRLESATPQLVVGIGASAGGIPALRPILTALPPEMPVAYLIMQHTDPQRTAELGKLLAWECRLPLKVAENDDLLEPGRAYLVPTDMEARLAQGRIQLTPIAGLDGTRHMIDYGLSAIADQYGDQAVGIILSGSGMDGTQGMRAIKAAGGITLVQDPASTEYQSMPESVIGAELADLILTPDEVVPELKRILEWSEPAGTDDRDDVSLEPVLRLLQRKTGFDFQQYKEGTVRRRLARRMLVNRCNSFDDYRRLLVRSENEAELLIHDLLISVTGFFRDAQVYETLTRILRPLVEERSAGDSLRVWVPGCATGEEPYSIAILLAELLGERMGRIKVQIFATDIDTRAIRQARQATYRAESLRALPQELVEKYFETWDSVHRLRRDLRDLVVFAEHDLIQDPPFTRIDLISCRNVLIYFKRPLQEQLLANFHYALRPGGLLLLGSSESAGRSARLFARADDNSKIYRRLAVEGTAPVHHYRRPLLPTAPAGQRPRHNAQPEERLRQILVETYAPPCALVNNRQEIVYVHGDISPYIRLPQGEVNIHLVDMAATPEIRVELRLVLNKVLRDRTRVTSHPVRLPHTDPPQLLTLVGLPGEEGQALVVFEQVAAPLPPKDQLAAGEAAAERIVALEKELDATREHLHANIEELETSNEELHSMNEEFQSTTEELQSTVEEYQTTNEELQSTNEELNTVNDELSAKSEALESANADMQGVLDNVADAIIVLDRNLHVTRYSAASKKLFDLWPTTIGRPFIGIGGALDLGMLSRDIHEAARTRKPVQSEMELGDRIYDARIVPRIDHNSGLCGVIIVLTDETERAQAHKQARLLATVVRHSSDAVIVRDLEDRILAWNAAAEQLFGYTEPEALGRDYSILLPSEAQIRARYSRAELLQGRTPRAEDTVWQARDGHQVEVIVTSGVLRDDQGKPYAITATVRDMGDQRRAGRRLTALVESAPDPILLFEPSGNISYVNARAEALFGYSRQELLGKPAETLVPRASREVHRRHRAGFLKRPKARPMGQGSPLTCLTRSGREVPVEINLSPIESDDGVQVAATIRDVTNRRREQQEVSDARDAAERANMAKSRFLAAASHDLRQPLQSLSLYMVIASGDVGTEQRKDVLAKMTDTLASMRSLLNTLLDLSRLDGGHVEADFQVFPIDPLLQRIVDCAQLEVQAGEQRLKYVPCSATVHSDPDLLEDMISNLLFNALKFTPHGKVLLGCRRRGKALRIDIVDTGPGIPDDKHKQIFEEFVQLHDNKESGLGLGLSIVKRLSELLQHPIELDSVAGRGSRFSVTVPMGNAPRDTAAAAPKRAELTTTNGGTGSRILFVDDDEAVRDSSVMFLELEGFRVLAAASSQEALRLCAHDTPDLLVVDYQLDGENGLSLVIRLRLALGKPALPAVLVTGESRPELEKKAADSGCRLLLKPVNVDELLAVLRALL